MPSCVFRRCRNYERKISRAQGIAYHMFPVDEERLREWVAAVRAQRCEADWRPSRSSRVCSAHFGASDKYVSEKGRILLRSHAVPIITDEEPVIKVEYEPEASDDDDDDEDDEPGAAVSVSAQGAWRGAGAAGARDGAGAEGARDDEFAVFARHVGAQMRNLPLAAALQAQEEIQSVLTRYRLQSLREP